MHRPHSKGQFEARGRPLLEIKKKVVEEVRKLRPWGPSIVLVPTIATGINDDQVGEILKFGLENNDVIRGVNFQPISLAGRITVEERRRLRFTLSDLAMKAEEQVGWLKKEDWYPVPFVVPISKLISVLQDEQKISFTTHPACGLATYLYVPEDGNPVPITRFVDVEGLMKDLWELATKIEHSKRTLFPKMKALGILRKHFKKDLAPDKMSSLGFVKALSKMMDTGDKSGVSDFAWKWFFVGAMHFQDLYNYDIQRVMRCAIHYATPDGRIIPFCAYNTGPTYREEVRRSSRFLLMNGERGMGVIVADSGLMKVDTDLCMHCGACVGTCPANAIFLNEVIITFDENCTQCGLCICVCPMGMGAIDEPEENPKKTDTFHHKPRARENREEVRSHRSRHL